ncbi:hypothetical protein SNEBB_000119 [Seison nebaliae]|nr:hypothetical protein SNEBB_000119 [Seison nebaliae]
MAEELLDWVKEQLFGLLNLSDTFLAEYLVNLAEVSKNEKEFIETIRKTETIELDTKIANFAYELWGRIPRANEITKSSVNRLHELECLKQQKKNLSYEFVDELKGDESVKKKKKKKKKKTTKEKEEKSKEKKKKKFRQRDVNESDSSEYSISDKKIDKRSINQKSNLSHDSESETEKERREVKEFNERIAKKNRVKSHREKKLEERAKTEARVLPSSVDEDDQIEDLRIKSRRDYLKRRRTDKEWELKNRINDEKSMFQGEKLTTHEKLEQQYNEKILRATEEYARIESKKQKEKAYFLPDEQHRPEADKDEEQKNGRYVSEQRKWEEDHVKSGKIEFASEEAKNKQKHYDLLDDDIIDFVESMKIPGSNEDQLANLLENQKKTVEREKEKRIQEVKKKRATIQETRLSLPIYPFRESLLEAIDEYQVLIIEGETGSGKTTQIPQYLYEHGFTDNDKKIACTQPRRVAAMSVAARVAQEMNVKLGYEVGYSIRFEDFTTERTVIKYMTDGMLLREFLTEPDLESYSVLIIDEAHERTLHTDILFGLVKDIAKFRPSLKLLISSATLDSDKFSSFFDDAPIFRIPGRRFPVDIYYTKQPEANYIDAVVISVLQIHVTQPLGDILVFLTGQEEIECIQELLYEKIKRLGAKIKELIVLPIFANLPSEKQAKIFEPTPPNARKVILATNIAETSLTIDGIIYVIDPGFSKQKTYNARTGMESLIVTPVSKASANQRAGRSGRIAPGKCFRLYTANAYQEELENDTVPEIQRTNLGNVVLLLKSLGINDLLHFDFMDMPSNDALIMALEQLYALGALNHKGELTKLGRRMAEFPLDPQLSKMLLASEKYNCTKESLTICAMLNVNSTIFYRPKDKPTKMENVKMNFCDKTGDHLTLMNIYDQWAESNFSSQWCLDNFIQCRSMKRARDIRDQLLALCGRVELEVKSCYDNLNPLNPTFDPTVPIRKSITAGFFYNTTRLGRNAVYHTMKKQQDCRIHPSSVMFEQLPKWCIYYELVLTSEKFMRQVTEIDSNWLLEVAPHYYRQKELDVYQKKKMPIARK